MAEISLLCEENLLDTIFYACDTQRRGRLEAPPQRSFFFYSFIIFTTKKRVHLLCKVSELLRIMIVSQWSSHVTLWGYSRTQFLPMCYSSHHLPLHSPLEVKSLCPTSWTTYGIQPAAAPRTAGWRSCATCSTRSTRTFPLTWTRITPSWKSGLMTAAGTWVLSDLFRRHQAHTWICVQNSLGERILGLFCCTGENSVRCKILVKNLFFNHVIHVSAAMKGFLDFLWIDLLRSFSKIHLN